MNDPGNAGRFVSSRAERMPPFIVMEVMERATECC